MRSLDIHMSFPDKTPILGYEDEWENLTKDLPEVDFLFIEYTRRGFRGEMTAQPWYPTLISPLEIMVMLTFKLGYLVHAFGKEEEEEDKEI